MEWSRDEGSLRARTPGLLRMNAGTRFQGLEFVWDAAKSLRNRSKHGLSLAEAVALWAGPLVTLPSRRPGEERHLAIGRIEGKCWTVIYAPRGDAFRLISARRARPDEAEFFHQTTDPDHRA